MTFARCSLRPASTASLGRLGVGLLVMAWAALSAGNNAPANAATYYQGGQSLSLQEDTNQVLVEMDPTTINSAQLQVNLAQEGFRHATPVTYATGARRMVYSVSVASPDTHILNVLRTIPGVKAARRAYRIPGTTSPLVTTDELVLKAKPGTTDAQVQSLAANMGCRVVGTMGIGVKMYILRINDETKNDAVNTAAAIAGSGLADFAHPDFYAEAKVHQIDDPLFPHQWHLQNRGQTGGKPGADVNAVTAWSTTLGQGAVVAILDDAIDWQHPDLVDNVIAMHNFVYDTNDPSPFWLGVDPSYWICEVGCDNDDVTLREWCTFCNEFPYTSFCQNRHGTATSGLAVARANSVGLRGVAPMAGLVAEAVLNATNAAIAQAFYFAEANGAQVVSNSWGFTSPLILPDVIRTAIEDISVNGRGGKGCLVMFSSGNASLPIVKDSALAAMPEVMAIGATLKDDRLTCYSNFGPEQSVVAPGGGSDYPIDPLTQSCDNRDIATTDVTSVPILPSCSVNTLMGLDPNNPADLENLIACSYLVYTIPGSNISQFLPIWYACPPAPADLHGYNPSDPQTYGDEPNAADLSDPYYTSRMNGTSSSCPIVAGCAALVFSVDSTLSARQVRNILEHTADKIHSEGAGYDVVTGHSDMFGQGRVNAGRAVQATMDGRTWPSPVTNVQNDSVADQVYFDWTNPPEDAGAVLIVRSIGPLNFAPIDGWDYAIGDQPAPGVIVVANDLITSYSDPSAPNGDLEYGIFVRNGNNYYSWGTRASTQAKSVPNSPLASVTASPSAGPAPLTVLFSGGAIDPQGREIVSYVWDFGDGSRGNGASIEHVYSAAGQYLAKLTVTNSVNLPSTTTVLITVQEAGSGPAPTFGISFSASPRAGSPPLTVALAASVSPVTTLVQSYVWDFGDNTGTVTTTTGSVTHTYTATGTFTAKVSVTDFLQATATASTTIVVGGTSGSQATRDVSDNSGSPLCGAGISPMLTLSGLMLVGLKRAGRRTRR